MTHIEPIAAPRAVAADGDIGHRPTTLDVFFERLAPAAHSQWAWDHYKETVEALAREFRLHRLIEIGGGRDPLFSPEEIASACVSFTINDISPEELRHAPPAFDKACFDVAGRGEDLAEFTGRFDLVFSRMVFEHVHDARQAWTNTHRLLAPGGIAIAFVPTLYAIPYLVNMAIPEAVSRRIVRLLYAHRTDDEDPKFPAYYDWCYGDGRRLAPRLAAIGFREAKVVPFWYHEYFESIPVARQIDNLVNRIAAARDWRWLTSYAFIVARK
jgi:SAM-dependent methyltransferase